MKHRIIPIFCLIILSLASALQAQTKWSEFSTTWPLASGDKIVGLDISDTTMGAGGTNKATTLTALTTYFSTTLQPLDATLTALSGATTGADVLSYWSGTDTLSSTTLSSFARTVLDDADAPTFRATIGAGVGNGSVTTLSVVTANGISGSVATATSTPAITLDITALDAAKIGGGGVSTTEFDYIGTLSSNAQDQITARALLTTNTFTGVQTLSDTTAATNSTTGALIVAGGVGIAKDSWINGHRIGRGAAGIDNNLALGSGTLGAITTGTSNVAVGMDALTAVTSGNNNVGVGRQALWSTTTGDSNFAAGLNALLNNADGSNNLALGFNAGSYLNNGSTEVTSPDNSIFIGYESRASTATDTNAIVIGYQALGEGDNTTVIGNSSTTSIHLHGAPTFDGVFTLPDGVRQTFNPDATNAGFNVGSFAGDPSAPSNGDIWYDSTANELNARINGATVALGGNRVELVIAASDEATALTTGPAKVTFRMPYAMTVTAVRASAGTAPTGSTIIVDINEAGSTIMTTNKLSIDASEKTSTTAATAAGVTDTSLADDAEITIDIDQVGSTIAGAGLKITLIGTR